MGKHYWQLFWNTALSGYQTCSLISDGELWRSSSTVHQLLAAQPSDFDSMRWSQFCRRNRSKIWGCHWLEARRGGIYTKKKAERVAVLQHVVIKAKQPQRKGEIGKRMQMKQPESSYTAYKYLGVSWAVRKIQGFPGVIRFFLALLEVQPFDGRWVVSAFFSLHL